ncbi:MAG: sulfite exporter TauE/SafE family protein [Rhizobiaceae bacterium]
MLVPETFALIVVTFLIAGTLKGTVGLGLPLVAIVFMAIPLGFKEAIAIVLLPGLVTNVWQALAGPYFRVLLKRLWPYLVACILGTWLGVNILSLASKDTLLSTLGIILAAYSLFSLMRPQIAAPGRAEPILGPLSGGLGGVFYGMTSVFLVPGVLYLQALGLKKDEMVQALGLVFILLNISMISAFLEKGFISQDVTFLSIFAILPTVIGIYFGQKLRRHISEELFRRIFFQLLFVIAIYFFVSAQM